MPAPAAPPPGHTALPAADTVLARDSVAPSTPFPQPSEPGVGAPLTPARWVMCPSASSQFSDPFDPPSLRPRVARCGGPAPQPGPGLFTHSPSIPSRRDRPLGRLRAAAPPPWRSPAPRLLPALAHCAARAPAGAAAWASFFAHLGLGAHTPNSGLRSGITRVRRFPWRRCPGTGRALGKPPGATNMLKTLSSGCTIPTRW